MTPPYRSGLCVSADYLKEKLIFRGQLCYSPRLYEKSQDEVTSNWRQGQRRGQFEFRTNLLASRLQKGEKLDFAISTALFLGLNLLRNVNLVRMPLYQLMTAQIQVKEFGKNYFGNERCKKYNSKFSA